MTNAAFNIEQDPEQLWREMGWGAKLAMISMSIVLIGTSLVASLFLAGAALFCALIALVYRLFNRGSTPLESVQLQS